MVFGEVECDVGWKRTRHELGRVFVPVTEDVDVESLLGHVVSRDSRTTFVVVVPHDGPPVVPVLILKLDDEPNDCPAVDGESDALAEVWAEASGPRTVVLPR